MSRFNEFILPRNDTGIIPPHETGPDPAFDRIPFSELTIMGIPALLFVLLAICVGLVAASIYNILCLCLNHLIQRPKVIGPIVEEAGQPAMVRPSDRTVGITDDTIIEVSSPSSPPPIVFRPLPQLPSAPPSPISQDGPFRNARSMPPTYVPTPFVAAANSPVAPNYGYYY